MRICIILYMPRYPNIRAEALAIAQKAKTSGITQTVIAAAIGASQPQVSRILSGQINRPSRLFSEISQYVQFATQGVTPEIVRGNDELIEALVSTWDGSAQHASALAAVIRSLGVLRSPPLPTTQRS